jgi:hypothetical protein
LEIVDVITPPATKAAVAPSAAPMVVIAAVIILGILGIAIIKKK